MAKFSIDRFPAGFFDLTQDLAGELPVDLIEQWTDGARSQETALRLLAPHAVSGAAVFTDAAGLTSLSRRRPVIEMLALLDQPKAIVYACGAAVGGEAIGVWAADNTGMLYRRTAPRHLLSALLETRDRIRDACAVQVGFCVHTGSFFLIRGGLYGTHADRVEHLAEASTQGGEILITDAFLGALGDGHPFEVVARTDVSGVFTVADGPRAADLPPADGNYPYPYSREFFEELRRLSAPIDERTLGSLHQRFAQTRTVVLVEHEREEPDVPEIAVLNDFALSAAMTNVGVDLLRATGGTEIKTAGNLGIYTFDDTAAALEFARRFRALFQAQGVAIRVGIDRGEVLVFDRPGRVEEIAGMPVNVASKVAQDCGAFGRIYLTEAAAAHAGVTGLERLTFRVAGVDVPVLAD